MRAAYLFDAFAAKWEVVPRCVVRPRAPLRPSPPGRNEWEAGPIDVERSVTASSGISPGATTLHVGRAQAPGFPLTGSIDDVAITDRALVPEEVAQLAQAPAPDPQ
jgi:hypothetical protein